MALEITNLRVLSAGADESRALGPEVSVLKIKGSEIQQTLAELQMQALGPDALPYLSEALEMDWVAEPAFAQHYAPVCAAALRPILQYAQDHDLRGLHRNSKEHHLTDDPGPLDGRGRGFQLQQRADRAAGDAAALHFSREYDFERRRELAGSALGYSAGAWAQFAELGLLSLPFAEEFGGLGRQRRRRHGGDGIDRAGPVARALLEHRRDVRRIDPRRRLPTHQAITAAENRQRRDQAGARLLRGARGATTCRRYLRCRARRRRRLALIGPQDRGARCPVGRLFSGVGAHRRGSFRRPAAHFAVLGRARGPGSVSLGLSHAVWRPRRRFAAR